MSGEPFPPGDSQLTAAEAIAQLVESEKRHRAITSVMQEGVLLHDADGAISWVNPRAERILGRSIAELTGGSPYDSRWAAVREDGTPLARQSYPAIMALSSGLSSSNVILGVPRPDGTLVWLAMNADPLVSVDGAEPRGAVVTFREVTVDREAERARTEFVSQVSHELRTPLTSIKGYVDLLLDDPRLTAEQREFLGVVKRNTERGEALISDLLDISRIDAGRLKLALDAVNVRALIEEIVSTIRPLAERHDQEIWVELPAPLQAVWADAQRVGQIVTNLLSNAQKYTPDGGKIHVTASDERGYVRIQVTDTGIGMSADEQSRLFQRFFRAQNRVTREVAGTGLGLTLARSLIELHGGQITCESEPGIGTTFSFTLPVPPPLQRRLRRADW